MCDNAMNNNVMIQDLCTLENKFADSPSHTYCLFILWASLPSHWSANSMERMQPSKKKLSRLDWQRSCLRKKAWFRSRMMVMIKLCRRLTTMRDEWNRMDDLTEVARIEVETLIHGLQDQNHWSIVAWWSVWYHKMFQHDEIIPFTCWNMWPLDIHWFIRTQIPQAYLPSDKCFIYLKAFHLLFPIKWWETCWYNTWLEGLESIQDVDLCI